MKVNKKVYHLLCLSVYLLTFEFLCSGINFDTSGLVTFWFSGGQLLRPLVLFISDTHSNFFCYFFDRRISPTYNPTSYWMVSNQCGTHYDCKLCPSRKCDTGKFDTFTLVFFFSLWGHIIPDI